MIFGHLDIWCGSSHGLYLCEVHWSEWRL